MINLCLAIEFVTAALRNNIFCNIRLGAFRTPGKRRRTLDRPGFTIEIAFDHNGKI
jgi:hypothetical protein